MIIEYLPPYPDACIIELINGYVLVRKEFN